MNKKSLILSIPLILATFLLGGWFLFREQKASEESPKPPVVGENQPQMTDQDHLQNIQAIPGNPDEVWYVIPEMGVRMKLNKEFAEDLVYKSTGESASFQKKSILAASSQCSIESADSGYLYKINGTVDEADRNNTRGVGYFSSLVELGMVVQFSQFFVVLSADGADACWWGKNENKAAEAAARKVYNGSGNQSIYAAIKNRNIGLIKK